MLNSAFDDYTAARTLLRDPEHVWQGAMFASMAIEKHLKTLLAFKGASIKCHLSNYEPFKKKLKELNIVLPYEPDANFVTTLSKSYKFRYFDELGNVASCGFFWWQLLSELDEIIDAIDGRINIQRNGVTVNTRYKEAVIAKDSKVLSENWVLSSGKKEEYMLRPGFIGRYIEEKIVILNFINQSLSSGHKEFVGAEIRLTGNRDQVQFIFTKPISAGEKILNEMILKAFES